MFGCSISEKRDRLSCLLEEHSAFKEVLEHYSNDSLKLKAACFLLKNLQYHKGYSEKEIEPLLKLYQIFGENDILYTDARDSIFKMYGNRLYLQPEKEIPDTQNRSTVSYKQYRLGLQGMERATLGKKCVV